MPVQKRKSKKLSLIPRRTEENVISNYTLESVSTSVRMAQQADNHYVHTVAGQKDVELTRQWESLPIYTHGDHMPKMELFKNFKKAVNNVL